MIVDAVDIIKIEVIVRNIAAGFTCQKYPFDIGQKLDPPILVFDYKSDERGDLWSMMISHFLWTCQRDGKIQNSRPCTFYQLLYPWLITWIRGIFCSRILSLNSEDIRVKSYLRTKYLWYMQVSGTKKQEEIAWQGCVQVDKATLCSIRKWQEIVPESIQWPVKDRKLTTAWDAVTVYAMLFLWILSIYRILLLF